MRKTHLASVALGIALLLGALAWWMGRDPVSKAGPGDHMETTASAQERVAAKPDTGRPDVPPQIRRTPRTADLLPPAELSAFIASDNDAQLDQILLIEQRADIDDATWNYLLQELRNQKRTPVVRNSIANTLVIQPRDGKRLVRELLDMAMDLNEADLCREYAIQHATTAALTTPDMIAATAEMLSAMTQRNDALAATALLHLVRMADAKVVPQDDLTRLARACLLRSRQDVTDVVVMAALDVMRYARIPADVRPFAKDPSPSVRRVVVAVLADIGEVNDHLYIDEALDDSDPLVAAAARAAKQRLDLRKEP